MNIIIRQQALQNLKGKGIQKVDDFLRYHNSETDTLHLDLVELDEKQIKHVEKALTPLRDMPGHKASLDAIKLWDVIKKDPKNARVWNLEQCATVMKQYISTSPGYQLFRQTEDGLWFPYVVTDIEYHTKRKTEPAHVLIDLASYKRGSVCKRSICIYGLEARKSNCVAILENHGFVVATQELIAAHEKSVAEFLELKNKVGKQMLGSGAAQSTSSHSWYHSGSTSLDVDGKKSRLVIDNVNENDSESRSRSHSEESPVYDGSFWDMKKGVTNDSDESTAEDQLHVPIHPILLVFNLEKHEQVWVHTSQLEEYMYDKKVGEKLVLPQFQMDLIELLMQRDRADFQDIIKGKTGGSIILCSGIPGTGKTLTAEVFSEKMERPLYTVQSSQLGTSAEKLEEELKEILERAARLGVVLLIDEADVFIHVRGDSIEQNAVVGVFLRVLEYYQGILFLTTNRDTLIDDAIISRCTAQVRFQVPDVEQQVHIWNILADCSGIKIDKKEIAKFAEKHPKLVGRDVKSLLKLANMIACRKKQPITAATIEYVMQFKSTNSKE